MNTMFLIKLLLSCQFQVIQSGVFDLINQVYNDIVKKTKGEFEVVIKLGKTRIVIPHHGHHGRVIVDEILSGDQFEPFNYVCGDDDTSFIGVIRILNTTDEGKLHCEINLENTFTQVQGFYDPELVWVETVTV